MVNDSLEYAYIPVSMISIFCLALCFSFASGFNLIRKYDIVKQIPFHENVMFATIQANSTYHYCSTEIMMEYTTKRTYNYTQHTHNTSLDVCPVYFNPQFFLSLIKNQRVGIFGDSIGLQLFHSLVNHLSPYQTTNLDMYQPLRPGHHNYGVRTYLEYNTTIYYCNTPYFALYKHSNHCKDHLLPRTDLLIVAIGAWYKPLFIHRFQPEMTWEESYRLSIEELNSTLHTTREYVLRSVNPYAKFIWRLQPHVGNLDEIKYFNESRLDHTMTHDNGSAWSDTSRLASWVVPYNKVISSVASTYGDPVVDWFTLSMAYIEHFNKLGVATHADSLHWCAAGLPRAANLLLQDAVCDAYS
jgi:hypothetical protein